MIITLPNIFLIRQDKQSCPMFIADEEKKAKYNIPLQCNNNYHETSTLRIIMINIKNGLNSCNYTKCKTAVKRTVALPAK